MTARDLSPGDDLPAPDPRRHRLPLWGLFTAALLARAVYVARMDHSITMIGAEMLAVARSVATTGVFADPFHGGATGPTAHLAPLPVYLMAGVLRLWPEEPASTLALRLVALLAASAQVPAVYLLVRRLGGTAGAALLAGVLAIYPASPFDELNGAWEAPYAALALCAVAWVMASGDWLASGTTIWRAGRAGVLAGMALLVTPAALLFLAGMSLRTVLRWGLGRERPPMRAVLAGAAGLLVVLAPWTVRNRLVMGHWFFVRDNLGLELAVANNPGASARMLQNVFAKPGTFQHPNVSRAEVEELRRLGEVAYNGQKLKTALGWIRANPERFFDLTVERATLFWWPGQGLGPRRVIDLFLLMAGALGGLLTVWRGPHGFLDLACGAVGFSALYYLVSADSRYSYPLHWAVCVLAAFAVSNAPAVWRRGRTGMGGGEGAAATSARAPTPEWGTGAGRLGSERTSGGIAGTR